MRLRKESTLFSTEPGDTKCMRSTANETRNTAEDERLSTKLNVHHLPKYLHLVLVMLLEITGRCHDFSYWTFKHSFKNDAVPLLFFFHFPLHALWDSGENLK